MDIDRGHSKAQDGSGSRSESAQVVRGRRKQSVSGDQLGNTVFVLRSLKKHSGFLRLFIAVCRNVPLQYKFLGNSVRWIGIWSEMRTIQFAYRKCHQMINENTFLADVVPVRLLRLPTCKKKARKNPS